MPDPKKRSVVLSAEDSKLNVAEDREIKFESIAIIAERKFQ